MSSSKKDSSTEANHPLVLGVGGSTGGFDAFQALIANLNDASELAIVFVQHLAPESGSLTPALLTSLTSMVVVEVQTRRKLKPGTIYVCPPRRLFTLKNGFVYTRKDRDNRAAPVIDHFFNSIAQDQGERGIGVVLSGNGTDGTLGLKAISDRGGLTFAQDTKSAQADSMPRSAALTGVADHVLPPEQIAQELSKYVKHMAITAQPEAAKRRLADIKDAIPQIADFLLAKTQHNFQHYKLNTLTRRIQRRMQVLKISGVDDYVEYLRTEEDEAQTLFRELLIGVTKFFRNTDAFDSLAQNVLPKLFEHRSPSDCVRIWIPGCASGQEAYTLAILCREAMEAAGVSCDLKIFATDIDERALSIARSGAYPLAIEEQVSSERIKRFFFKRGKRYHVVKEVRDTVLFSVHNLISDPPFSRLDLISCRNLLIYLGPHLQKKLIPLFHYALRPDGYLFLGSSESITSHAELFRSVDTKARISQRKGTAIGSAGSGLPRSDYAAASGEESVGSDSSTDLSDIRQRIVLDEFAPKSVIVDNDGKVVNAAPDMQKYLTVNSGNYQNNIMKMTARGLRIGLRAAFTEARKTRRRVDHENLSIRLGELTQRVMITVQPMPRLGEEEALYMVVFQDVGKPFHREEVETSNAVLSNRVDDEAVVAQLERELETTRDDLERTLQEMEATNEELKSSNEELLSMNEELQSANEELETSKEEIRAGSEVVSQAKNDLENLLQSSQIATVFLDNELRIRSFTPAITQIYDLIPTDVGRRISRFAPLVDEMPDLPDIQETKSLTSQNQTQRKAIENTIRAASGKSFIRRVLPYVNHNGQVEGMVVTFVDVTELRKREMRFRGTFENAAVGIAHVALTGEWLRVNDRLCEIVGYTRQELLQKTFQDITHPDDLDADVEMLKRLTNGEIDTYSLEKRYLRSSGEALWTKLTVSISESEGGEPEYAISVVEDIDEQVRNHDALQASETLVRTIAENSTEALVMMDDRGFVTYCNQAWLNMSGFDQREMRSKSLHDLVHHHYADGQPYPIDECPIQQALPENTQLRGHEDLFFRKDGSAFHVVCAANPIIREGKPSSTVLEIRDVTQQRLATQKLATSRQQLAMALRAARMGSFVWDKEANVLTADGTLKDILEMRSGPKLDKGALFNNVHPDDLKELLSVIDASADEAGEYLHEYRIVRTDNKVRWLSTAGSWLAESDAPSKRLSGLVWDITERKNTENAIRLSEERLRIAARSAGFGTFYIDLESNSIQWSDEFKTLVGLQPYDEPTIGIGEVPEFVHPDDKEKVAAYLETVITDLHESDHTLDHRIVSADGDVRHVRMQSHSLFRTRGTDKQIYAIVGTVLDISRQHANERLLQRERRIAQAASESKSKFVANMSHEIRTPMTAVLGYTDLLSALEREPKKLEYLQIIKRNGSFLLDIMNDILDISKIEAGKMDFDRALFAPHELVAEVHSTMKLRAAEKHLAFDVEYEGLIPEKVRSDPKRLKQILVNLIGNAIKFTNQGKVSLVVRLLAEPASRLQFEVIDTGIGMTDELQERLFQPFMQGDMSVSREFGGTGLGLAISRHLAKLLGGDVSVASAPGKGSTFTFSIDIGEMSDVKLVDPADADLSRIHNTRPADQNRSKATRLNCHVLVVDDSEDIRLLVKQILTDSGATVDVAQDGYAAVSSIEQALVGNTDLPDLILLDMQMPRLDGYQTASRLRKMGFDGPIIALTADAMHGDMARCIEAGCNAYLSKPVDAPELVAAVHQYSPDLKAQTHGNVLIVEDSIDAATALQQLFKISGVTANIAHTGKDALAYVEVNSPRIILLDLNLPDMSGFDLLDSLQALESLSHSTFVAMTGQQDPGDVERCLAAGFQHHIGKPVDFERLLSLVQSVASDQ